MTALAEKATTLLSVTPKNGNDEEEHEQIFEEGHDEVSKEEGEEERE